jgi:C-terminal processing protease CtpA/Prc
MLRVRRLALAALIALPLSGCYLYRPVTSPVPMLGAAVLSRSAAVEDLDSLVTIIREVHPNPAPDLGAARDSLVAAWPDSLPRTRVWRDLARLAARNADGHTSVYLDGLDAEAALARGDRLWSLAVRRSADTVVVARVVGPDTAVLRPGDRIVAIAGRPVESLVQELGLAVSAELDSYRDHRVMSELGRRLWAEGIRPPAEVEVIGLDGAARTVALRGAAQAELAAANAGPQSEAASLTVRRTADSLLVLDFPRMSGDRAAFTARLDSAFEAPNVSGVRAVVVDLRRNGGGDSDWGVQLLSYLTSTPLDEGVRKEWKASRRYRAQIKAGVTPLLSTWLPFSWIDAPFGGFFSGPDGTTAIFPFTPKRPPANARRVERPVCLLIGPRTFSSAMMLANTARRSKVATLIGEPTGEPPNSHGEILGYHLRRSGLSGQVSSAYFMLDEDPEGDRRGVPPHLLVVPTRESIASGQDPVMERARECGRLALAPP